jgi:hypothetical protein
MSCFLRVSTLTSVEISERCNMTYRGLDKLISIRTSTNGKGRRGGGAAPDNGGRGQAEGLTLNKLRLVKDW